jgi:hypothetical protein
MAAKRHRKAKVLFLTKNTLPFQGKTMTHNIMNIAMSKTGLRIKISS